MIRFILRRMLLMIPVLLGVMFIVFTINYFGPGDPVAALLGGNYTQEQYDAKEKELGLDQPYAVQFVNYIKGIVTELDLGTSYQTRRAVRDEILDRFPTTLLLGMLGVALTVVVGIPFGIISATKQYSILDYIVTIVSLIFASIPSFWMAMMFQLGLSYNLGWFPATYAAGSAVSMVMPVLTLGLSPVATVTRITRSSMLDVVRQDYIRTARAKGLSERQVIWKHALKNALIPVITVVGMQIGMIMAGSVVVEAIFNIPGLGSLMMTAINNKDYPVIQGSVLFISLFVSLMNLLVDLIYGFVDPRIKAQYGSRKKKQPHKAEQPDLKEEEVA